MGGNAKGGIQHRLRFQFLPKFNYLLKNIIVSHKATKKPSKLIIIIENKSVSIILCATVPFAFVP